VKKRERELLDKREGEGEDGQGRERRWRVER